MKKIIQIVPSAPGISSRYEDPSGTVERNVVVLFGLYDDGTVCAMDIDEMGTVLPVGELDDGTLDRVEIIPARIIIPLTAPEL